MMSVRKAIKVSGFSCKISRQPTGVINFGGSSNSADLFRAQLLLLLCVHRDCLLYACAVAVCIGYNNDKLLFLFLERASQREQAETVAATSK